MLYERFDKIMEGGTAALPVVPNHKDSKLEEGRGILSTSCVISGDSLGVLLDRS